MQTPLLAGQSASQRKSSTLNAFGRCLGPVIPYKFTDLSVPWLRWAHTWALAH